MTRFYLRRLILLLLLGSMHTAMGQVRFTASVNPAQIAKDEYAELKFSVENAGEVQKIQPPALNDFVIVGGPNEERGMTMINGDEKKYVALSYIIKPKKPGQYNIPAATAIADGLTLRSAPVAISVSNAVSGNRQNNVNSLSSPFTLMDPFADAVPEAVFEDNILKKGENADDKIRKNILVRVETNKNSCYVGEPIVATYKLYTRLKSESNMTRNPSFNGFSVIDLQQASMNYERQKLEGREYNVYTIRKVQLYPLQPGNLELEPAEFDNIVHFIKAEYAGRGPGMMDDFFGGFGDGAIPAEGIEDHRLTLQSKPLSILVKPLPDANKPADFKGAVGNFKILASLEKNQFTTDDVGKLTVIIGGEGNLQLVTAPVLTWPEGIDAFEPKGTDDLFKTTIPVSGRKIIDYPFTVSTPGTYTLPPVNFSYFDNKEGKYKTISTAALPFTVSKGTGKPKQQEVAAANNSNNSILNRFFSSRLRVVSTVAILIICGLIFWLQLEKRKQEKEEQATVAEESAAVPETSIEAQRFEPVSVNPLAAAEENLHQADGNNFYVLLNQSLKQYLSDFLQINPEELNRKTISEEMDKKGISNQTSLHLQQLMDEIEWQLYTPFADASQKQELLDKTHDMIQLLNTYRH